MAKDERMNLCKPKISSKPVQNFMKCSHLNLPPFVRPQNCPALFAGCASTFIICRPTKRSLCFAYSRAEIADYDYYSSPCLLSPRLNKPTRLKSPKLSGSELHSFIPVIKTTLYKPKTPLKKPNFRTHYSVKSVVTHTSLSCFDGFTL